MGLGMRQLRTESGFSMVETILSSLILSVSLGTSVLLMQNVSQANVNATYQVAACQLANGKLETIIADNSLSADQYAHIVSANYPNELLDYRSQVNFFTRQVSIAEVAEDLNTPQVGSDIKRVRVTVSWGTQPFQKVTLATIVTNYN